MKGTNLGMIIVHALDMADKKHEERKAYGRAKRKAKKLGVTIRIERDSYGNGYWLENTGRDDDNFCSSWVEVEEKLNELGGK